MSGEDYGTASELLEAGAVLPPGTPGAGEKAVPLTARAYRHPGLDDRVVVRLVAGDLGAGEDLAAGFLGLSRRPRFRRFAQRRFHARRYRGAVPREGGGAARRARFPPVER